MKMSKTNNQVFFIIQDSLNIDKDANFNQILLY